MPLEKQMNAATAKQKAMIAAVIIMVLVVVWQVKGLVGGDTSAPPAVPSVKSSLNQGTKTAAGNAASNANGSSVTSQSELRQGQVMSDARFLQLQQMNEQKYISKVNDLEDLKIQREIAETNQAIAAAKLATVTAEKNISDLLTKPAPPEVPQGAYANKLANPVVQGEQSVAGTASSAASSQQVEYTVISVSMQLGKWSAVVGYQGKLYNVGVGDELPADHSMVVSINKGGVVLKKDGITRKVNIMLAI